MRQKGLYQQKNIETIKLILEITMKLQSIHICICTYIIYNVCVCVCVCSVCIYIVINTYCICIDQWGQKCKTNLKPPWRVNRSDTCEKLMDS